MNTTTAIVNKLDLARVKEYVDKKWIKSRISGNLQLLCYNEITSRKVKFKKGEFWDDMTRTCRGLVINKNTGDVIAYCMPKCFNLGEKPETLPSTIDLNEPCHITEKLDGTMITSFINPDTNEFIHTTKGSFDTKYSKKAKEFFPSIPTSMYGYTFVSEIRLRDSEDDLRRVTKQKPGLYLITVFDRDGKEFSPKRIKDIVDFLNLPNLGTVKHFTDITLKDVMDNYPTLEGTEGFVVRFENGRRVKFKTPWYRERNMLLDEINDPIKSKKWVKECYLRNKSRDFIDTLPPEYIKEVTKYVDDLVLSFGLRKQIVELMVKNNKDRSRKDIGIEYGKHPYQGPFFFMLDGKTKEAEDLIWESL